MKEYFDKNPESLPYLERLEEEWKQHGKIIIAVDYDDTISPWKLRGFDPKRTIEVLKVAQQTGAWIVIFTACKPDRHPEIMKYCEEIGITVDAINKTPIDLPYGNDSKIYANIFIDDRAGLNEALQILEFATYRIRGSRQRNELFDF